MSWNLSVHASMSKAVDAQIDEAADASPAVREHAGPQLAAAKAAALALLTAVARDQDEVFITLSGHHNAGCTPVSGWADCVVHVTVGQVPAKEAS